jgi:hypothetical protein
MENAILCKFLLLATPMRAAAPISMGLKKAAAPILIGLKKSGRTYLDGIFKKAAAASFIIHKGVTASVVGHN